MSIAIPPPSTPGPLIPTSWTMADLQAHLGNVPARRIRLFPSPGTATEEDAFRLERENGFLCELVDGVLVEKVMGAYESVVALYLSHLLQTFLDRNNLGFLMGEQGPLRPRRRKMRMPDISFISWSHYPDRKIPREKVLNLAPDLAVEVLSEGNTPEEMHQKLDEYFSGGTRLAWIIDPERRKAAIYTSLNNPEQIDETGLLDGRDVLPGFMLRLGDLLNAVPSE